MERMSKLSLTDPTSTDINRDGSSNAKQRTRMFDQTGIHKYHVFEDDELLCHYSMKTLNRLIHGPNIDASDWSVYVTNIREGSTTTMSHHCSMSGDHAKTPACFSDNLHLNYCPCWEYKDGVGWVRCGILQKVMSVGCSKHRDDEMRKVFDKLRKKYPVTGEDLNNPNLTPVGETVKEECSKDELVKKAEKAIEKQIEDGGDLDEDMYMHSQLKAWEEEKYRRKATKEASRGGGEEALSQDLTTARDAKQLERKYIARPMQDMAERRKPQISVPELDEKAKNNAKSKQGSKIWNRPGEPEKQGRFERAAAVMGVHRKTKEKTRGGSKKNDVGSA